MNARTKRTKNFHVFVRKSVQKNVQILNCRFTFAHGCRSGQSKAAVVIMVQEPCVQRGLHVFLLHGLQGANTLGESLGRSSALLLFCGSPDRATRHGHCGVGSACRVAAAFHRGGHRRKRSGVGTLTLSRAKNRGAPCDERATGERRVAEVTVLRLSVGTCAGETLERLSFLGRLWFGTESGKGRGESEGGQAAGPTGQRPRVVSRLTVTGACAHAQPIQDAQTARSHDQPEF